MKHLRLRRNLDGVRTRSEAANEGEGCWPRSVGSVGSVGSRVVRTASRHHHTLCHHVSYPLPPPFSFFFRENGKRAIQKNNPFGSCFRLFMRGSQGDAHSGTASRDRVGFSLLFLAADGAGGDERGQGCQPHRASSENETTLRKREIPFFFSRQKQILR